MTLDYAMQGFSYVLLVYIIIDMINFTLRHR